MRNAFELVLGNRNHGDARRVRERDGNSFLTVGGAAPTPAQNVIKALRRSPSGTLAYPR